jgi:prepilin peptidase CpaA
VITVLLGLLVVAVYTDLRVGKIYNKLTLPCIAFGMTMRTAAHGLGGLADSLCGAGLVLGLFALFAPKVGIGGGDTKLMMAVGALTGLRFAAWAMLASAIAGGVLAVAVAMRHRALSKTVGDLAGRLYTSAMTGVPAGDLSGPNPVRIPYSPAIALGSLVTLLAWTRFGPA